jgi:hypothetical protein
MPGIPSPGSGTRSPPAAGAARPRTPAVSADTRPGHRPGRARSSRMPPGRTPPCHPGCRTASAWKTARRAACRACGRTCRAATCPSASSYTGYRRKAAWTTSRNPCPAAAGVPLPARPAPRSARPTLPAAPRPAHRDPRQPAAAGHCRPPAPLPAHAAIRPGQRGYRRRIGHKPQFIRAGDP